MNDEIIAVLRDYLPTILGAFTAVISAFCGYLVAKYNKKRYLAELDRVKIARSSGYYVITKKGDKIPLCDLTFYNSDGIKDDDLDPSTDD